MTTPCNACQLEGYSDLRVPGILLSPLPAHCGFIVERCDSCERYASDEAAEKAIRDAIRASLVTP
jgi:hypothetical protein